MATLPALHERSMARRLYSLTHVHNNVQKANISK
jgi:hypothetical protein